MANCGLAGEVSDNGLGQVRECLELFPKSRYFVIGFGTNDLGIWSALEKVSKRVIANLDQMVQAVRDSGKQPVLFNVPYANESRLPAQVARDTHAKRDFHNSRLREFCEGQAIPLADICPLLRDRHFADELHPNEEGAKIIAQVVHRVLTRTEEKGCEAKTSARLQPVLALHFLFWGGGIALVLIVA